MQSGNAGDVSWMRREDAVPPPDAEPPLSNVSLKTFWLSATASECFRC